MTPLDSRTFEGYWSCYRHLVVVLYPFPILSVRFLLGPIHTHSVDPTRFVGNATIVSRREETGQFGPLLVELNSILTGSDVDPWCQSFTLPKSIPRLQVSVTRSGTLQTILVPGGQKLQTHRFVQWFCP